MAIKLGSNIASLQAQRRLGEATSSLESIYERLSSGQRINRASDDAAGLAIAEELNSKGRVFAQAIRNGNDGISLLNIADSAVEALSGVVARIRELAEQSANGTYSNTQRKALDAEAQALSKEFTRISQSTSFNGIKVFNGSLGDGLRLQLGYGVEGSINTSIGGAIGLGSFGGSTSLTTGGGSSYSSKLGDLNGDGILDLVTAGSDGSNGSATVRLGTGNGNFGVATSFATEGGNSYSLSLGDLNNDGILDLVTAGASGSDGYVTVRLGSGTGSFGIATSYTSESGYSTGVTLGDLNADGILDLVTTGITDGVAGYANVRLGNGNGSFGGATSYTTESALSSAITLADLNRDNILDLITSGSNGALGGGTVTVRLGTGSGSFAAASSFATGLNLSRALSLGDLNGDGILDIATAGMNNFGVGYASVQLGTGNGSFGSATSFTTETAPSQAIALGDLNGDGALDLITAGEGFSDGYTTIRLGSGSGTFGSATSYVSESWLSRTISLGDLNSDGTLDIVTAGLNDSMGGGATTRLGITQDGLSPLLEFSLKTKSDALQSMGILTNAQNNLSKQRGVIGANQSRVGIAIDNLMSARENFAAAESRIRDADIAADAANLVRTQILQQAATAILAQANQAPSLVLTLLKNN